MGGCGGGWVVGVAASGWVVGPRLLVVPLVRDERGADLEAALALGAREGPAQRRILKPI